MWGNFVAFTREYIKQFATAGKKATRLQFTSTKAHNFTQCSCHNILWQAIYRLQNTTKSVVHRLKTGRLTDSSNAEAKT